jgi:TolA-binding protein
MLKPKKKITKKEIKQDGLITAYAQATSFYYENKKYISYGITALVIVVIASFVYINNKRGQNETATTEFGKVFGIFDKGTTDPKQYQIAIDGQPERGIKGLKYIVDNYGGTQAGELARFYLASAYYSLGKYDDALKNFDSFSGGSDFLKASAYAGVAGCYEAKGDYGQAAAAYDKASRTISDPLNTPEYLSSAARCYGQSGDKSKAVTLLKKVKQEYPASTYAREADRYIAQFSS